MKSRIGLIRDRVQAARRLVGIASRAWQFHALWMVLLALMPKFSMYDASHAWFLYGVFTCTALIALEKSRRSRPHRFLRTASSSRLPQRDNLAAEWWLPP
ncbi:hypothetical protein [Agathobaculum butyriciproducens]|uniref:hypothetical protein n=1 Tax=Agathobaculum butyriciproducens TaxID=1628085 RepID=UPI0036D23CBE